MATDKEKPQTRYKPNEIPVPKKYTNSCAALSWFTAGWNDEMNESAGPAEADLVGSHGEEVWEAYAAGRKAAEETAD